MLTLMLKVDAATQTVPRLYNLAPSSTHNAAIIETRYLNFGPVSHHHCYFSSIQFLSFFKLGHDEDLVIWRPREKVELFSSAFGA